MNWKYEYFVDSPGLAKASLNSGSGSTLLVRHSPESLYSAAGGAQNSSSQVLGSLLAEYTYSAYGDVLMRSGELADKNHVTYSTRYSEGNTGLIYYTYRHYAPRLHKWINKDPIAEQGGINLYQIVGNEPVGDWDVLGLSWKKSKKEDGKIKYTGKWPYDNAKTLSNIIRLDAN